MHKNYWERLEEYIKRVDELNKLVSYGSSEVFKDGKTMSIFWNDNRENLYKAINLAETKKKYPNGCNIIQQEYLRYLQTKVINKPLEYIAKTEELGRLIRFGEKQHLFSNGDIMAHYWNQKEVIYALSQTDEIKAKYPIACKVIEDAYLKYHQTKTINKDIEYIEKIEELGRLIRQSEEQYQFSNGESMRQYWSLNIHKNSLYELAQLQEIKAKYPIGSQIIIEAYLGFELDKKHRSEYSHINKIEEYMTVVEELKCLVPYESTYEFSDGVIMYNFWHNHNREKLYKASRMPRMQTKYPLACQIINREYLKAIERKQRKTIRTITKLCEECNIDVEINKDIIEHISYEEFFVKLNYLQANGNSIVNEEGVLHEIFSMCSANMEDKYGISLEDLIKEYYVSEERKPGV